MYIVVRLVFPHLDQCELGIVVDDRAHCMVEKWVDDEEKKKKRRKAVIYTGLGHLLLY